MKEAKKSGKAAFYTKRTTKSISKQSTWPCKQVQHPQKRKPEGRSEQQLQKEVKEQEHERQEQQQKQQN